MKTKHVTAIFIASLVLGAALVWALSRGPTAVQLIPPAQFASQKEVGALVYEKLHDKLAGKKLLIVGIPPQPEVYQDIFLGFVERFLQDDKNIVVLKEPKWPALPANLKVETYDFVFNDDDLGVEAKSVQQAINDGKTLIVYTVSIYATHLIPSSPVLRFEHQIGHKIPSVTVGPLVLRHDGENLNDPACVGSMRDEQGLYELGCAQITNSRNTYKALLPLDKLTATLGEQAENDFLLQLYLPPKR